MLQASDDYIVHHKADNTDIVLFLYKETSGFSGVKKKVCAWMCVACASIIYQFLLYWAFSVVH